ncbi:MAG: hypothetical protein KF784_14945 [Fimbriimonadaceae bacterium]|nr:hypothetical protein [Fimbriimonadaceae bacterium]
MPRMRSESESWRVMVLKSMPPPAWLDAEAPQTDVILSSRVRLMRNLQGHFFPNHADPDELKAIQKELTDALRKVTAPTPKWEDEPNYAASAFEVMKDLSPAEREYLVGCRLVSPEFHWREPGRAVLLDPRRMVSIMVNEEDHLRLQALTPGWTFEYAYAAAHQLLAAMETKLTFAWSPKFGFLSTSPFNCGMGVRVSSMFHLIGLAQNKELPQILRAMAENGVVVRGLFGESSRAVGAFVQISTTSDRLPEYEGAIAYLAEKERQARVAISHEELYNKASAAAKFAVTSQRLTLAHALRVLTWVRWAAAEGLPGFPGSHREVDSWLTTLELRGKTSEEDAQRDRAEFFRDRLAVL